MVRTLVTLPSKADFVKILKSAQHKLFVNNVFYLSNLECCHF